jgi:O-acetyl-ADP-ribose deacetylase (regulator of RNase III)
VRLETWLGDLTTLEVDAVVNAANAQLIPAGGVDGALNRAAGPQLGEAMAALGGCTPGDAKATPGFALPARWVIHTVGPIWRGGERGEADVLSSCYRRSLQVAESLGARTISFPAISTGIYGYPPQPAASVAVAAVRSYGGALDRVVLVAFSADSLAILDAALGAP